MFKVTYISYDIMIILLKFEIYLKHRHIEVASLQRSSSVKHIADHRGSRFATDSCVPSLPSPWTLCGGVHFEHAKRRRRGVAFAQRARQGVVGTLLMMLCARCKCRICCFRHILRLPYSALIDFWALYNAAVLTFGVTAAL